MARGDWLGDHEQLLGINHTYCLPYLPYPHLHLRLQESKQGLEQRWSVHAALRCLFRRYAFRQWRSSTRLHFADYGILRAQDRTQHISCLHAKLLLGSDRPVTWMFNRNIDAAAEQKATRFDILAYNGDHQWVHILLMLVSTHVHERFLARPGAALVDWCRLGRDNLPFWHLSHSADANRHLPSSIQLREEA